jgi:hypothetical protein
MKSVKEEEHFGVRVTRGEFAAIGKLVELWREETGDGTKSGWFRGMVRREAKARGVAIVEPGAHAEATLATSSSKRKKGAAR